MSGNGMAFFPTNFMLQTPHEDDHQPPTSLNPILPPCTPQDFHGNLSLCLSYLYKGFQVIIVSFFVFVLFWLMYMHVCVHVYAGVASFLGKRSMSFSGIELGEEANGGEDDLSDDGSQAGEKKRRLNMEQVKTLEKNFELGNKLEPERKMQLARALNLQPRQIAIWFQNRRARWKTKQLEKDYEILKRQFEAIKADNDALQAQNQKLQAEVLN